MKSYIKHILFNPLVFLTQIVVLSSCSLFEEETSGFPALTDIEFSYTNDYVYTTDTVSIAMDMPTLDAENVEVYLGDTKAEIVSSMYRPLLVKIPIVEDEYASLTIRSESETVVISDNLRIYPGTLDFEFLGETPFEGRRYMLNFKTDDADYLYSGVNHLFDGTWEDSNENWVFEVESNQWKEVEVIEGLVSNVSWFYQTFFYQGVTYRVRVETLIDDKEWLIVTKLDSNANTWSIEYDMLLEEQVLFLKSRKLRNNNKLYMLPIRGNKVYMYNIEDRITETLIFPSEVFLSSNDLLFASDEMLYLYNSDNNLGKFIVSQYNLVEDEFRQFELSDFPVNSFSGMYSIGYNGYSVFFPPAEEGMSSSYYKITSK